MPDGPKRECQECRWWFAAKDRVWCDLCRRWFCAACHRDRHWFACPKNAQPAATANGKE
jgi:hypothetical protein